MNEIGEILKEARMDKGITLYDVYEITRITPKYLEAIEEGQWDKLPGPAYTRGYIRSYADVVEVDSDYLIELFEGGPKQSTVETSRKVRRKENRRSRRLLGRISRSDSKKGWTVLLVGVILLALFIRFSPTWTPSSPNKPQPEDPTVNLPPADLEPEPEPEPEEIDEPEPEPEEPVTELSLLEEKTNSSIYEIVTDKAKFTATITTGGPCWVRIVTDDDKTWEKTMQEGDTHTVEASDKITIRMGLPQNANIEVEGLELPHMDSKNPYNYTIKK